MKSKSNKSDPSSLQFIRDFLPLLVFFAVYKFSNYENPIIPATIALLIATFISLAINFYLTRKLAKMPLFSALILGLFGSLTIFSGDEIFIKIKPTLINLLFAIILLIGYLNRKPFLKILLEGAFSISDKAWMSLSLRWAIFFVGLAVLNEVIWRNFPTDFWVQFKVFGILPISIAFTISQIPFIIKKQKEYESNSN